MMAMTSLFASAGATAGTTAAVGAAGTAAVAAGATGAAATGASLLSSFGVADVLSGVFTGVSVIGGLLGTASEVDQAEQLAADRDLQALTARNAATLDEVKALEELRARISESVVNAFAGGVAPTGSVQAGIEEAVQQQEFETTVGGRDARIRAAQLEAEADAARGSTSSILFKGLGQAAEKVDGFLDRRRKRGGEGVPGKNPGETLRGMTVSG